MAHIGRLAADKMGCISSTGQNLRIDRRIKATTIYYSKKVGKRAILSSLAVLLLITKTYLSCLSTIIKSTEKKEGGNENSKNYAKKSS